MNSFTSLVKMVLISFLIIVTVRYIKCFDPVFAVFNTSDVITRTHQEMR